MTGKRSNQQKKRGDVPLHWVKINALMGGMKLGQGEFAERLGVSPAAISYWKQGREPSGDAYVKLAALSLKHGSTVDAALWFLEKAGLAQKQLVTLVPQLAELIRESEARLISGSDDPRVPLSKDGGFIGAWALKDGSDWIWISLPTELVPVPSGHLTYTSCMRAPDRALEPLIRKGDVLIVDAHDDEPEHLDGSLVVARYEPAHQDCLRVLQVVPLADGSGLSFHLMTPHQHEFIDPSLGERPGSFVFSPGDQNWRILGRVRHFFGTFDDRAFRNAMYRPGDLRGGR